MKEFSNFSTFSLKFLTVSHEGTEFDKDRWYAELVPDLVHDCTAPKTDSGKKIGRPRVDLEEASKKTLQRRVEEIGLDNAPPELIKEAYLMYLRKAGHINEAYC